MRLLHNGAMAWPLVALLTSLAAVGAVTRTPLRHALQAAPVAAALLFSLRHARFAWAASAVVSAFWLSLMAAIWLTLLGVARLVPGHFPPHEIALTVCIGVSGAAGLVASWRARSFSAAALAALVATLLVQTVAFWLSLQPAIARR